MIAKTKKLQIPKSVIKDLPTIEFVKPKFVYIATNNARCPNSEIYIKPGDKVKCCQVIGKRVASFFEQPIHATVSGTYIGLEKHFHRSGKLVEFMKIENDGLDTLDDSCVERSEEEIFAMNKDEITEIIKDTSLVGLGGSSFPTYIKFQTSLPIHTILINGIECEPLISSDHRMMMEHPSSIMKGVKYALHAFGAKKAVLCYKKKHKDITNLYKEVIRRHPDINLELCELPDFYPQGWEVAMIKNATGIEMKHGELPSKYGIIDFNVSTIYGIAHSLKLNQPIYERNITVSGDGIKYPQNMLVKVGTSLKELIDLCGGYVDDKPKVCIMGGPMMGVSNNSDDIIVTKTVTSIIILNHREYKEEPCVRCGSCGYSCPASLIPVLIMNAVKSIDKERIRSLHPERCVECGLCAYNCTSKINVTDFVKRAKIMVR